MVASGSRWRRARFGLACALACLPALFAAAGASASQSFDVANATSVTLDGSVHYWNQGSMDREQELSYGGYQYTSYWDQADGSGNVYLKITRRQLSNDALQTITFNEALADPHDPHDTTVLGISPVDGRLHVTWTEHAASHHYAESNAGCLSQATFTTCTFTDPTGSSTFGPQTSESAEAKLTYPEYVNDANGNLYYLYRYYTSREGDLYLNKYNNDGTWTQVGRIVKGKSGGSYDPDGTWTDTNGNGVRDPGEPGFLDTSTTRSTYPDSLQIDKNNRMHLMWTYREDVPYDYGVRQHDIYYATSDDGGVTWQDNGGTTVGNTSTNDPILVADTSTKVVTIAPGYWREPIARMELDSDNQPHVVMGVSDAQAWDINDANIRVAHYWRTVDGTWHQQWVEPAGDGVQSQQLGSLMFDRADDAFYIYERYALGWYPYNSNTPTYNNMLPSGNVTYQDDGTQKYLNIVPASATTALDSTDRAGIPIGTGSGANRKLVIRLKNNTAATQLMWSWTTDADTAWTGAKSQTFTISANDTSYQTYTFTLTDADWTNTLRLGEMYFLGNLVGTNKDIRIDYVRIQNDSGTIAKQWEFNQAPHLMAAEATSNAAWASWSIYDLLPGVPLTLDGYSYGIDKRRFAADGKVNFPVVVQGAPGTDILRTYQLSLLDSDPLIKNWSFPTDAMGWTALSDVSSFGWASDSGTGALSATLTGGDSAIVSADNLKVPTGSSGRIHVRLKNTTASTTGRIWFVTDASGTYNSTKSKVFTTTANSGYTWYSIDMSAVSGWSGQTLRQLRLDPANDSAVTTGSFKVDRIYIDNTP